MGEFWHCFSFFQKRRNVSGDPIWVWWGLIWVPRPSPGPGLPCRSVQFGCRVPATSVPWGFPLPGLSGLDMANLRWFFLGTTPGDDLTKFLKQVTWNDKNYSLTSIDFRISSLSLQSALTSFGYGLIGPLGLALSKLSSTNGSDCSRHLFTRSVFLNL